MPGTSLYVTYKGFKLKVFYETNLCRTTNETELTKRWKCSEMPDSVSKSCIKMVYLI